MSDDNDQTKSGTPEFDFSAYPFGTLFHERREGRERRKDLTTASKPEVQAVPAAPRERRARKERRRRIDPTTFEKEYTVDEIEFMNAMQRFKERTGSSFPTHGEVLKVAAGLGYRRVVYEPDPSWDGAEADEACLAESSIVDARG
jgi:hypothetical protein